MNAPFSPMRGVGARRPPLFFLFFHEGQSPVGQERSIPLRPLEGGFEALKIKGHISR